MSGAAAGKVPPPAPLGDGVNIEQGINDNELLLAFSPWGLSQYCTTLALRLGFLG